MLSSISPTPVRRALCSLSRLLGRILIEVVPAAAQQLAGCTLVSAQDGTEDTSCNAVLGASVASARGKREEDKQGGIQRRGSWKRTWTRCEGRFQLDKNRSWCRDDRLFRRKRGRELPGGVVAVEQARSVSSTSHPSERDDARPYCPLVLRCSAPPCTGRSPACRCCALPCSDLRGRVRLFPHSAVLEVQHRGRTSSLQEVLLANRLQEPAPSARRASSTAGGGPKQIPLW